MKTVGFPISHKENEKRRALLPDDILKIKNAKCLYFENGYGEDMGYSDNDYIVCGANIQKREEILTHEIICDPKIGDAEYLDTLKNQTIFGWIHAVQNRDITDKIINGKLTAYAWEDMFYKGKHCFWRNNEVAGEAAIMHAYMCYGLFPYDTKVAVLGRGNVARGAIKTLNYMGAQVTCYDRHSEELFREELEKFDVVVNGILWDTTRKDHIIYKEDLKRMKKGSMIVDISCDRCGGVETSVPTTIEDPTYVVDGVMHYVVDHTPSIFFKTSSKSISEEIAKYIDSFIEDNETDVLQRALIIKDGNIVDERISIFQNRRNK